MLYELCMSTVYDSVSFVLYMYSCIVINLVQMYYVQGFP